MNRRSFLQSMLFLPVAFVAIPRANPYQEILEELRKEVADKESLLKALGGARGGGKTFAMGGDYFALAE